MCHLHSINVRVDGAKCHIPSNSHSGASAEAKWRENEPHREKFFVEVEGVTSHPTVRGAPQQFPQVNQICCRCG